jgi:hypothetical protein
MQLMTLKALADAALIRNASRNKDATDSPKHTQQITEKQGHFVACEIDIFEDRRTCRECRNLALHGRVLPR